MDDELEARYHRASAALERGNIPLARREFDVLALDAPWFAPAWDGLGRCYEADGDLRQAGVCFRKAMRADRGAWASRYHWGMALHRAGDLKGACRWLREAARLGPDERRVLLRLGQCRFDMGQTEAAIRDFRAALKAPERDVGDADLLLAIAAAEAERGDLEAADEALQQACLFAPDSAEVYYQWALLTARAGDPENAVRLANRARALDSRSFRAPLLLANLALDAEDWSGAANRIREIRERRGGERLAHALDAELARRRGSETDARQRALEALHMAGSPDDGAVDAALSTLRRLHPPSPSLTGYRLVLEVDCGDEVFYRPYVVLAEDEEQARWMTAAIQDDLDPQPWSVVESETFDHEGEAYPGVYQLLLSRAPFPKDRTAWPVG